MTLKLTREEGREIVYEESDRFKVVTDEIVDNSRWSIQHTVIFKDTKTGKYYSTYYSVGATEQQDEEPFEYYDPELTEVHKVEKVVEVWEAV